MSRQVSVLYCEDMRFEVDGKYSLVGCIPGDLFVQQLPGVLPKFCAHVRVTTDIEQPFKTLSMQAVMNGKVVGEITTPPEQLDQLQDMLRDRLQNLPRLEGDKPPTPKMVVAGNIIMSPFFIEAPSILRIVVQADGEEIKGPGIRFFLPPSSPESGKLGAADVGLPAPH